MVAHLYCGVMDLEKLILGNGFMIKKKTFYLAVRTMDQNLQGNKTKKTHQYLNISKEE